MCEDDAAALRRQKVSVVLFRSDSYDILSLPTPLAEATVVSSCVGPDGEELD